jgi:hypothetical protein
VWVGFPASHEKKSKNDYKYNFEKIFETHFVSSFLVGPDLTRGIA